MVKSSTCAAAGSGFLIDEIGNNSSLSTGHMDHPANRGFAMRPIALSCVLLASLGSSPLAAREWKDSTGKYAVEADLVAFTDKQVVLKRDDGKLITFSRDMLSAADRKYLNSKEADKILQEKTSKPQTWTMKSGLKVVGRPVSYGRKEIVIQRRRGKIYVNDRLLDNLPDIYQRMLPRIVAHFENVPLTDKADLVAWVTKQGGRPHKYTVDGVILELENGDEYAVPFLFFSDEDLKVLQPGWERWLAAEKNVEYQQREDFLLRAQAQAYQQDRQINAQIAAMQLMLSAVDAGVTNLWEVYLYPRPGVAALPQYVIVPARDSRQAILSALAKNPNYIAGPARKLNRP
jgi:hypothetical protein